MRSLRRSRKTLRNIELTPTFALLLGVSLGCTACQPSTPEHCSPFGDRPATIYSNIVPNCGSGVRLGPWKDSDGTDRYACLYQPSGETSAKPLPLVVFLHPSLLPANSIEKWTDLLDYVPRADLSGDPAHRGFLLLAPEGRNIHHYYAPPDASGLGWDNWYRQFNPSGDVTVAGQVYRENVDVAAIDHFIADELATGKVDAARVFLSGWSNGGAMAYAYGLNRPNIAAVAVYSAPDPYELALDLCPQTPVTGPPANMAQLELYNPRVPTFQVHNDCDIAGLCPNTLFFEDQMRRLGGEPTDTIVDREQHAVASCDKTCGSDRDGDLLNPQASSHGAMNHLRWPDQWTHAMLAFFRAHPLNQHP